MSTFAFSIDNLLLAVHVGAAMLGFGVMFAYPVFLLVGNSIMDPGGLVLLHRAQRRIIQRFVTPGLVVVAVTGFVLAEDLGTLSAPYVMWGIVSAIVLGVIAGAYLAPREGRLATLAERDLRSEAGVLSREYEALSRRVKAVTGLASLIVLGTIFLMIAHT